MIFAITTHETGDTYTFPDNMQFNTAAEARSFYLTHHAPSVTLYEVSAFPVFLPLLDIRLNCHDAGAWHAERVKDANGWRNTTEHEAHSAAIVSPKAGYYKHPNGRYTESGRYELQTGEATVQLFDTRHEARAALLVHLNQQQQPKPLTEPLTSVDFQALPGFQSPGYRQTICTRYGIESNLGIYQYGPGKQFFERVPELFTAFIIDLADASDERGSFATEAEAIAFINAERLEEAKHAGN